MPLFFIFSWGRVHIKFHCLEVLQLWVFFVVVFQLSVISPIKFCRCEFCQVLMYWWFLRTFTDLPYKEYAISNSWTPAILHSTITTWHYFIFICVYAYHLSSYQIVSSMKVEILTVLFMAVFPPPRTVHGSQQALKRWNEGKNEVWLG